MRKSRKTLTLAAAMSVCLAFISAPAYSADTVDALPEIIDSAAISSMPVASGVLTDSSGAPVGKGKLVIMYAWPNNDFLAKMANNESAKLVAVAKATTRADGKFDMRIADPGLLTPLKSKTGQVELMLSAQSGADAYSYNFSRRMEGASAAAVAYRDPGAPEVSPPADPGKQILDGASLDGSGSVLPTGTETQTVNVTLAPIKAGSSATGDKGTAATIDESVQYGDKAACASVKTGTYSPIWVTVGQTFVDNVGVWADFSYTSGVSTSMGVGVSTSGGYGTYSAGGTSSVSAQGSIDFPRQGRWTSKRLRTMFVYDKHKVVCVDGLGHIVSTMHQVRPVSWAGGSQVVEAGYKPGTGYCTPYMAGSVFKQTTNKAITWSNGAAFKGTIGVDLSSQTGYSNSAMAIFDFQNTRNLCGSNGYPGSNPVFLTVK